MTSLLYDIAGRSEDAFNLTWNRIDFDENGGGFARLVKGKTTARRVTFSPRTEKLLKEHRGASQPTDPVFNFNSVNSMIKWLERFIKQVTLPPGNNIVLERFQSHNLRVSKLTWLSQHDKLTDAQIQAFSGHKKLENLLKYIKVDVNENMNNMLKEMQMKETVESSQKPMRKREEKQAAKKEEKKSRESDF